MVFLGPLLFMRNLYDAINLPKLWLVMIGVALVAGIRLVELLQGASRRTLTLLAVPAAALLGPLTIGWLFSPYKGWALLGDAARYTGLVPYAILILFGALVADAFGRDLLPVAWALVASGAVAGAYALVQVVGLDPYDWTYKDAASNLVTSTLGNPNFAGGFFSIVLPLAVAVFLSERERRPWAGGCLLLIGIGWIVTRSETAWGAGLSGLAILAGGFLLTRVRWARLAGFVVAGSVALAGVGLVGASILPDDPGVTPRNLERRGEWWEASLGMLADSPLVGRGPNAFALEHTRYRTIEDVDEAGFDVTDDPHSVPLSLGASGGVIGIVGFLFLCAWVARKTWDSAGQPGLGLGFGAAACAYLVQSLLSVDTVALRLTAWTVFGALAASTFAVAVPEARRRSTKTQRKRAAEPLQGLPGVAVAILLVALSVWWSMSFLMADAALASARRALAGGEGQESQDSFQRAMAFRDNPTYAQIYAGTMTPVAVALAEEQAEDVGRGLFKDVRESIEEVEEVPQIATSLAWARALDRWVAIDAAVQPEALAEYERALVLDPLNYLLLHEAAVVATEAEDLQLAENLLRRGLALRETADLWGQLGLVYALKADEPRAVAAIEQALALDPDQASAIEARELIEG